MAFFQCATNLVADDLILAINSEEVLSAFAAMRF